MFVRLIKPFKFYPVGRILDVSPGVADVLAKRGLAQPVKQKRK